MLRIQYASNLFVNKLTLQESSKLLKPVAPVLALLGNIGHPHCNRTKAFMIWAEQNYDRVLWIPGALEYSSEGREATTWNEKADRVYESLNHWSLRRTTFCQKLDFIYPGTEINILATSLGFPLDYSNQYYVWNTKGEQTRMTSNEQQSFMKDELHWLRRHLQKKHTPTIVLSHQPVLSNFGYSTHLVINIHGIWENDIISFTGGKNPWRAINMAGHRGYISDAYFTLDENKDKDMNMQ